MENGENCSRKRPTVSAQGHCPPFPAPVQLHAPCKWSLPLIPDPEDTADTGPGQGEEDTVPATPHCAVEDSTGPSSNWPASHPSPGALTDPGLQAFLRAQGAEGGLVAPGAVCLAGRGRKSRCACIWAPSAPPPGALGPVVGCTQSTRGSLVVVGCMLHSPRHPSVPPPGPEEELGAGTCRVGKPGGCVEVLKPGGRHCRAIVPEASSSPRTQGRADTACVLTDLCGGPQCTPTEARLPP